MPTIAAQPYDYTFDPAELALVVIDMQRDFLEPGGFGAALGNDVSRLAPVVPVVGRLLAAFRERGLTVVHTKECHRPDLSDCPPAKRRRGRGSLRIGDPGPMGRILIDGEPGNDFVPSLRPQPGELVIAKPGKGAFYATDLHDGAARPRHHASARHRRDDRGLRADDDARGQRPRLRVPAGRGRHRTATSRSSRQATLAMVTAQGGIVGWTARAEQVLAALA